MEVKERTSYLGDEVKISYYYSAVSRLSSRGRRSVELARGLRGCFPKIGGTAMRLKSHLILCVSYVVCKIIGMELGKLF